MHSYLWLIPILPLAGAVINLLLGRFKASKNVVSWVGVGSVGGATVVAFSTLIQYFLTDTFQNAQHAIIEKYFIWIKAGTLQAEAALLVDPLSAVMLFFVTFVGFLIHLYSVGYMHGESDEGYARYFAYLNLFMFSMLILILGANLPLMFVGWEGVGLCSYLLIGYYFNKDWCAAAGKKAFIVNRIGDLGFILAIFVTLNEFGTADFLSVFGEAAAHPDRYAGVAGTATVIGLLLFVGAIGKSAQMPLYVWLPDAMAGPTPVSALIHAATMVTAGVYMVVRCNVIYRISPTAMVVVAVVGGVTAIFAATIGICQNDIKKVLAYSTVSQLGYMFLGAGAFGFVAAIFHVLTHAFFKACLFLGSGSVIHACGGEQDMRKMGGLWKHMPITAWTFLIATIAIAGFPPLAGFFSKDEILAKVFEAGHGAHYGTVYLVLYGLGLAGAAITAFYMFRCVYLTFFGEFRGDEETRHHLHESPWTMTVPLVVLAFLSVVGGWIGLPGKLFHHPEWNRFEHFLEPILPELRWALEAEHAAHPHVSLRLEWLLVGCSVLVAVAGFLLARRLYFGPRAGETPQRLAEKLGALYRAVLNKYYVDELYGAVVVTPLHRTATFCWKIIDTWVIDFSVNLAAFLTEFAGDFLRFLQTGNVRNYALSVALGVLALAVILW